MPDEAAETAEEPVDVVYLRPIQPSQQVERIALVAGVIAAVALVGLVGWLGFTAYAAHNLEAQRNQFIQAARQGAVNLSTIDYQHADADAQRILDSATGTFYDSLSRRKQSFIDNATRTRSKSVGTVTDAGLESQNGDQARVLVAVTVNESDPTQAEHEPQFWRMRITVKKVGDVAKVSDVVFMS
jgi:Mce-associated membrane protein